MTLKAHWKKGDALKAIRRGGWTHVVLQEQSLLGVSRPKNGISQIAGPETFFEHVRKFDAAIKSTGAKTVLYLTWARQNAPENQRKLNAAYHAMRKELKTILIPAGIAWWTALKKDPALILYQDDQSHPTPLGTYLVACVFYAAFFKRTPVGLPRSAFMCGSKNQKSRPVLISQKDADLIQWSVQKTLKKIKVGIIKL